MKNPEEGNPFNRESDRIEKDRQDDSLSVFAEKRNPENLCNLRMNDVP
jgi:hypothetical protein